MFATEEACSHSESSPALLDWAAFRDKLEGVDIVRTDDKRDGQCSWVIDREFGDLAVRKVGSTGVATHGQRTPTRINIFHEEVIWICLVMAGQMRVTQHHDSAQLGVGDMIMVDSLQPYEFHTNSEPTNTLWIGAPRSFLSRHIWDVDELLGVRIDGSQATGRIAARTLHAGFHSGAMMERDEANRVAHGLFDVLGVAADNSRLRRAGWRYRDAVVHRIKSFIDCHLDDETLTVQRIADAQGLSARYLSKMFETESETVSGWIWSRRLEKCHAALAASDGRRTISDIAYDHGFKNVSHFSRAFRDRYAMSPRELVQAARRDR